MAKKNLPKVGRPPLFESVENLQSAIQDYFTNGMEKRQKEIKDKGLMKVPVPTITGLCLHLGFASRQAFYDLQKHREFSYTVKRARMLIEREYEEQLQKGNPTGAIFALKNFGWMDTYHVQQGDDGKKPRIDLNRLTREEREQWYQLLEKATIPEEGITEAQIIE